MDDVDHRGRVTFGDRVRLYHTDAFGVLFWGSAFGWAQQGVEMLFEHAGHPIQEALDTKIDYPVRHASIDYLAPLHLGDQVWISTSITKAGRTPITVETQVRTAERLAITLTQVLVAYDRSQGAPVPLEDWLRSLAEAG